MPKNPPDLVRLFRSFKAGQRLGLRRYDLLNEFSIWLVSAMRVGGSPYE
jgi:hypothetical protein